MLAVHGDQNDIYETMNFYQARKVNEIRNVKYNVSYLVSISSILKIQKDSTKSLWFLFELKRTYNTTIDML